MWCQHSFFDQSERRTCTRGSRNPGDKYCSFDSRLPTDSSSTTTTRSEEAFEMRLACPRVHFFFPTLCTTINHKQITLLSYLCWKPNTIDVPLHHIVHPQSSLWRTTVIPPEILAALRMAPLASLITKHFIRIAAATVCTPPSCRY